METKTPNILIIEDEAKKNLFCVISFIFFLLEEPAGYYLSGNRVMKGIRTV